MEFVHFHAMTDSSVYCGTLQYDDFIDRYKVMALTDNHWCQIFEFHDAPYVYQKSMQEKNISVDISDMKTIFGFKARVENVLLTDHPDQELILIAKTKVGFDNLLKLTSLMHLSEKETLDWATIRQFKTDIVCISGSLTTEIGYAVYKKVNPDPIVDFLKDEFGENLFLEIQEHYLAEPWEQNATQYCLNRLDVPLILTNEVRYLNREDAKNACIYFFSSPSVKMTMERSRFTYNDEFYLKSPEEMFEVADNIALTYLNGGRAYEAFENTVRLAKIIDHIDLKAKESHTPYIENADEKLRELTYSLLPESYKTDCVIEVEGTGRVLTYKDVLERIEYELHEITSKSYSGFFIILEDLIRFCRENDIAVGVGRGSAGGSVVLYILNVIQVCPLTYDLLFERFLNPKRISDPDVDIDIESKRRGEVIDYLEKKYGEERISQILTIGTLAGRSALRATCKGMSVDLREEERLSKLVPSYAGATLQVSLFGDGKDINPDPNLLNEYNSNPSSKEIFDIALWVEKKNLISKFGIHAGGVVISKDALFALCPLVKGDTLRTCVAMSMKRIEKQKFVKYDLLGVKILDVIKKCMNYMGFTNLRAIPLNDEKVFSYLSQGNTFGVFQFNKTGDIMNQMGVSSISDLTVINALNRPGPMAQIPTFIRRKHGESYDVFDPRLKETLDPTFGIMVYQETIMKVSQVLCDYDLGEADLLRRAIGKKDREVIEKERGRFISEAVKNGFSEKVAEVIYDLIEFFADYGFNKSHAVEYAITAYICAYFKFYIPVVYMSAMLEAHQGDNDDMDNSPFYLRLECERMGISFLPPSVNDAELSYSPYRDEMKIQYGLTSLKHVGATQAVKIIENRPYSSFDEFIKRSGVSGRVAESLIKAGSFDFLHDRNQLLCYYDQLSEIAVASESEFTLFDFFGESLLEEREPAGTLELLEYEKEVLGTYLSEHPMKYFKDVLMDEGCVSVSTVSSGRRGKVKIGCMIAKVKQWKKRNGCFAKIEDDTGTIDAKIFSSTFDKLGIPVMKEICNRPIILEGFYKDEENQFVVTDASFVTVRGSEVIVNIADKTKLDTISAFLNSLKSGSTKLLIVDPFSRKIVFSKDVLLSDVGRNYLRNVCGDGNVSVREVS